VIANQETESPSETSRMSRTDADRNLRLPLVRRLCWYRNSLLRLKEMGFRKVYSQYLGESIGVTSAMVRKDFSQADPRAFASPRRPLRNRPAMLRPTTCHLRVRPSDATTHHT